MESMSGAALPPGGSRRSRRQRRLILGGAGAVLAAGVAVVLVVVLGGNSQRAGTLVGDTVPPSTLVSETVAPTEAPAATGTPLIDGGGAQALLDMLGISMPTSASVDEFSVAPGFTIQSMTVEDTGGAIVGTAVVSIGSSGLTLSTDVSFTDTDNWSFVAASTSAPTFSPVAGLTVDPSSITGAISKSAGQVAWSLAGSTITWPVTNGVQLTTQFSISNTCPLDDETKCPEGGSSTAYIGMPAASLTLPGFPNTITVAGGVDLSSDWARLEGSVGAVAFEGNGITDTELTLWRGERRDMFDPNMSMPDLSSLNGGANFEFCGTFTIAIPQVTNKSTGGCARWSNQGVVLAQVGGGTTVTGTVPSTDTTGAAVQEPASAEVKGLAWSNLSADLLKNVDLSTISFSGVSTQLANRTFTLAGVGSLPGVAAKALNVDLRGAASLQFDVRGTFAADRISLSGTIPVSIKIGSEPFKIDLSSLAVSIEASTGRDVSFSIGSSSDITLGYGSNSRVITSSTTLAAATKPSVGMVLSVNARGKAGSGDSADGLTASTRLARPDLATYVWPDQFGIKGLNLWNMTVQIGFTNGSPQLAYSTTTYLDPQGGNTGKVVQCNGACDPTDWMVSNLLFNASYTNPCFAYGFDGTAGGSSLAIDGGVLKTSVFKVGIAPAGCFVQQGDTATTLPVAFAGFQFTATFGNTTLDVATQTSVDGFVFTTQLTNLVLAGITYPNLEFTTKIDSSGSQVYFAGSMRSDLGTADVVSDFVANGTAITQSFAASVTDWRLASADFQVPTFTFNTSATIPTSGGCLDMSALAKGTLKVKSTEYNLTEASFRLTCNGLQSLVLSIDYLHSPKWNPGVLGTKQFTFRFVNMQPFGKFLSGSTDLSYKRGFSKRYCGAVTCKTFDRNVTVGINMSFSMNTANPGGGSFAFGGEFSADRVSGAIGCAWDGDGKAFTCGGQLRLNPSWAGVYRFTWGDL